MVGFESSDDACVLQIDDSNCLIQTVDFFTPMVDDPYLFGQIAAANALSDVYAMGGQPRLAMNLLCVPNCLSTQTVNRILQGGHSKAMEAGCLIAGGHSIQDNEPKYGLCVAGFVHKDRLWRNIGARVGDVLVLTKPLGSGILSTAQKGGIADKEQMDKAYGHMAALNKQAAALLEGLNVHACTDVTGFGLLGHALEMAEGSGVSLIIATKSLPVMDGAYDFAQIGIIPAGAYRNLEHIKPALHIEAGVDQTLIDIAADPQTSGGLLVALSREEAAIYQGRMEEQGLCCALIATVEELASKRIILC